jgi:hypothetical protein
MRQARFTETEIVHAVKQVELGKTAEPAGSGRAGSSNQIC